MVDPGISRTQDIQNPLPVNTPASRLPPDRQEEKPAPEIKAVRRPAAESASSGRPGDLEAEVQRLNGLLGGNTRLRFVINPSTNDVFVEGVAQEHNRWLKTVPPAPAEE